MTKIQRTIIKAYLRLIPRHLRPVRTLFIGRRLLIKQYNWLHFNKHPWEQVDVVVE